MIKNSGDKKVRGGGAAKDSERDGERTRERERCINAMRMSRKNQNSKRANLSYQLLLKQRLFQVRMYNKVSPWLWVSEDKEQRR